jgi:hypothetical protein
MNVAFKELQDMLVFAGCKYVIKDNTLTVTYAPQNIDLNQLEILPANVIFNNKGNVYLNKLKALPDNVIFNNAGYAYLQNIETLSDTTQFNNTGEVDLRSLTVLSNNIKFHNKGGIDLYSIKKLPENKYSIFMNSGIVHYNYNRSHFNPNVREADLKLSWIPTSESGRSLAMDCYVLKEIENGLLLTDLNRCYIATKAGVFDGDNIHPDSIWMHNQSWLLEKSDEPVVLPTWVDKQLAAKVLEYWYYDAMDNIPEKGIVACYYPTHNKYTGGHWYASNERDALIEARVNWSPLDTIKIENREIVFDSGDSAYGGNPIQLWNDGKLSMFNSNEYKATGNLDANTLLVLKFAVQTKKYRGNGKWKEILDTPIASISEFREVKLNTEYADSDYEIALADDKYILIMEGVNAGEDSYVGLSLRDRDDPDFNQLKAAYLAAGNNVESNLKLGWDLSAQEFNNGDIVEIVYNSDTLKTVNLALMHKQGKIVGRDEDGYYLVKLPEYLSPVYILHGNLRIIHSVEASLILNSKQPIEVFA